MVSGLTGISVRRARTARILLSGHCETIHATTLSGRQVLFRHAAESRRSGAYGRVLGSGSGPITEKIQTLFFDVVNGRAPKYKQWLTPVNEGSANERDPRRSNRPVTVQ